MIVGAIAIGIASAVGAVSFFVSRSTHQARLRAWLKAARFCGLADLAPTEVAGFPTEMTGTRDGLHVKIERWARGKSTRGTRVVVSPLRAVSPLHVRTENIGTAIGKSLGKTEVLVGDTAFDERFLIEGPAPLALAVLDAATRRLVWSVMSGRTVVQGSDRERSVESQARLDGAALTVEFTDTLAGPRVEDSLAGLLGTILELAANLAAPRDVPLRLAENALHDPLWAVRLANLRMVARECRTHAETARMLRAACFDLSEEVRLTAALALGAEGLETLERLAFEPAPDGVAARAVAALGRRIPPDRATRGLGEALAQGRVATACAFMEALGRAEDGATAAEPHLTGALEHAQPPVRLAAARALGRVGTVAAVLALQQASDRFGSELRRVSRQAVALIQARAVGATPGQLSLSGGGAGNVSLTDEPGGRVSLPDDRAGG